MEGNVVIRGKCVVGLPFHQCLEMCLIVDGCTILTNEVLILSENHLFCNFSVSVRAGFIFEVMIWVIDGLRLHSWVYTL